MKLFYATAAILGICGGTNLSASPLSFLDTFQDTDFVSAGAGGLRGTGTTDIELSGLTGDPEVVYLYWHGPTSDDVDGPLQTIDFNGTQIVGESIGTSDDNFWGRPNSQAYRADVTALVSGDGSYTVSGTAPNDGNGASLVAFFDDGDDSNNRDYVVFDGNDANFDNSFDPLGWSFGANGIEYTSGDAFVEFHVSDGQNFGANDDSPLLLNGTTLATGGIFQGDTTPFNAATTVNNGSLWDIREFDITSFFTPGSNDLLFTLGNQTDALSLIFATISLPSGSASNIIPVDPNGPVDPVGAVPVPASIPLLITALGGFGLLSSRRKNRMK